jgi:hypothetical protein
MHPPRYPFHLAFPVTDLPSTRQFYTHLLGAEEGRCSQTWVDFNFFGHQLTAHLQPQPQPEISTNWVDGDAVPVRHFGVILNWEDWQALAERLRLAGTAFVIEPRIRFAGEAGEQATLFIRDPSGNALEFKAFQSPDQIFARD